MHSDVENKQTKKLGLQFFFHQIQEHINHSYIKFLVLSDNYKIFAISESGFNVWLISSIMLFACQQVIVLLLKTIHGISGKRKLGRQAFTMKSIIVWLEDRLCYCLLQLWCLKLKFPLVYLFLFLLLLLGNNRGLQLREVQASDPS